MNPKKKDEIIEVLSEALSDAIPELPKDCTTERKKAFKAMAMYNDYINSFEEVNKNE